MLYLIIGRSNTGKKKLAEELINNKLKELKLCTTAPETPKTKNKYTFVTPDEAATITNKVFTKTIDNYEYFITESQIKNSDFYITTPEDMKTIIENNPKISFHIVHCTAIATEIQKNFLTRNCTDKESEQKKLDELFESENNKFLELEKNLKDETYCIAENAITIHTFENDYEPNSIVEYTLCLSFYKTMFKNLMTITDQCVKLGVINSSEPNHCEVYFQKPDCKKSIPYELFVDSVLANEDGLTHLLKCYLGHPVELNLNPTVE